MSVDLLLLKFNSDEKQFTRLFVSVIASDCILILTNGGQLVALCGGGWALRTGIGMTTNLSGHFRNRRLQFIGRSQVEHTHKPTHTTVDSRTRSTRVNRSAIEKVSVKTKLNLGLILGNLEK